MPGPKGCANGAAKLTPENVRIIRKEHIRGKNQFSSNRAELARRFNVAPMTISSIVGGITWGWVDD